MFRAAAALEESHVSSHRRLPTTGRLVIGLEVHAELATATKLFCGCPNQFGDEPNTNI